MYSIKPSTKHIHQLYQVVLAQIQSSSFVDGCIAIITLGLWASTVCSSGYSTFSVTTIQGKHWLLSPPLAQLKRGQIFGWNPCTPNQQGADLLPDPSFFLRAHAIRSLDTHIASLSEQQHVIILLLDANQTLGGCINRKDVKTQTIEWLHISQGMEEPFISLTGSRP